MDDPYELTLGRLIATMQALQAEGVSPQEAWPAFADFTAMLALIAGGDREGEALIRRMDRRLPPPMAVA